MRIGLICNEVCVGSLTSLRYMLSYVGRREKLLLEYVFIQNLKSSYFGPCWWKPHVWKVWDSAHLLLPLLFTNIVEWMSYRLTKILFSAIFIFNFSHLYNENIVDLLIINFDFITFIPVYVKKIILPSSSSSSSSDSVLLLFPNVLSFFLFNIALFLASIMYLLSSSVVRSSFRITSSAFEKDKEDRWNFSSMPHCIV